MELPVVATVEIQGERVVVRAAPLSLVARLAKSAKAVDAVLDIVARCCTLESGAPVDIDALSFDSASRLVKIAVGEEGDADFCKPPASREPAG